MNTECQGSGEDLQRLNWALSAFARSSSALIHSDDFSEMVTRVCTAICENSVYVVAWVGLADQSPGKPIKIIAGAGHAAAYMDGLKISWADDVPEGNGPSGRAIRDGVPQIMRDALSDPAFSFWREKARPYGIRSSVTVPFTKDEQVVGAMMVYAERPDAFGPSEVDLFSRLGAEIGFALKVAEDRARLKASEDARNLAITQYWATFNLVSIGIAHLGNDGRINLINNALCKMFGARREEILLRNIDEFSTGDDVTESGPTRVDFLGMIDGLVGSATPREFVWPYSSVARQRLWAEVSLQRVSINEQDVILAIIRDITERRATEFKLRQAQKLEAIGQLAGGIAHDFNNLLGIIIGFAQFLKDDLPADSKPNEFAARILGAGQRGKALVGQILAFARARSLERGSLDLRMPIQEAVQILGGLASPNIQLETYLGSMPLPIRGNAEQINQLVLNLCVNARDAMSSKGIIRVELTRRDPRDGEIVRRPVVGEFDPSRVYAELTVSDQGSGIPREIIDRMFEPFFTTKGVHGGTGLGLAIVHGVVTGHSGACVVESVPGKGTTFTIYFPLEVPSAAMQ